ncbi:MAG TPA: RDD family protein [Anaerolineales bacterium]|nr:RDD family protein [Anaerolineales bacterium]
MHINSPKDFAKLHHRIIAYLVDSLLSFLLIVTITQTLIFVPLRETIPGAGQWFNSGWKTELYTLTTISLPIWFYFGIMEASSWRATIGKRLLKLQTLSQPTRQPITPAQAALRTIIKMLPWELAHLTNNLPVPMWYDPDPGFRIGFAIVPILAAAYLILILTTKNKQSLHDLVARTVVVRRD